MEAARAQIAELTSELAEEKLKREILEAKLRAREEQRNERFVDDAAQLSLLAPKPVPPVPDGGASDAEPDADEADAKAKPGAGKPRRRRLQDLTHLPHRTVRVTASASNCGSCGRPLVKIGEAESFRIEWVPGHFERLDVVTDKCACSACPSQGVLSPPNPFLLPRAMCGNALLARVLVDKFADHLPLNRQADRMAREGFEIATNVLAAWVVAAASKELLGRIVNAMANRLQAGNWLQADDTGFPVQDGVDGKLRKGRLWSYTDQQEVVFRFTDTKHGRHMVEELADFRGALLVDCGSEFNQVVREVGGERAGCWSHLRRYFFDARLHHPAEARVALRTIRELFLLERALVGETAERILEVRSSDSRPLVDALFAWANEVSQGARPKSLLGGAVAYARSHEASFRLFLERPELPMHNNLAELLLRGPVVGRKNWLFAGSEGGAHSAARMFSLIGSCMLQGVDPQAYLTDVMSRLPSHPANRVHELTPMAWRIARL